MISLATAIKLKEVGLAWEPAEGDRFAIPGRGLDEQVFVIADMAAIVESIRGHRAVTFHGTPEWALDYLWLGETVWLPSQEQLHALLQQRLEERGITTYDLLYENGEYLCCFEWQGRALSFRAADSAEACATALLYLMGGPE